MIRMAFDKCVAFLLKVYTKLSPKVTPKELAIEKARLESLEIGKMNLELEEYGFAVKGSAKTSNNDLNPDKDAQAKYKGLKADIESIAPFMNEGIWFSYGSYVHRDVKLNKEQAKADKLAKENARLKALKVKAKAKAKATK